MKKLKFLLACILISFCSSPTYSHHTSYGSLGVYQLTDTKNANTFRVEYGRYFPLSSLFEAKPLLGANFIRANSERINQSNIYVGAELVLHSWLIFFDSHKKSILDVFYRASMSSIDSESSIGLQAGLPFTVDIMTIGSPNYLALRLEKSYKLDIWFGLMMTSWH